VAVVYTHDGFNADGSPHFVISVDTPGAELLMTGPITGTVVVGGVEYDVTPEFIEVPSRAVALAISDAIGARHQAEGHPLFVNDPESDSLGFVAVPSSESHPQES
jgi:hypothetical protein